MIEYKFTFDETVRLPSKMEVCWRCEGHGSQDVWDGGMTGDEMAEQGPEFFEDYMSGVYSKPCEVCHGRNVIEVVDREAISPELLARYDKAEEERLNYEAEAAAEARYFSSYGSHLEY